MLNEANVRQLHTALKNAHFTPSPRLGSEPTIARLWAAISLFKHTAGIQYTLVFKINFKTQIMTVESYQLSRYDHLM
jgi:hypothetical protein